MEMKAPGNEFLFTAIKDNFRNLSETNSSEYKKLYNSTAEKDVKTSE